MVRRCWKFILVCWVPFPEVVKWHSLLLQDQDRCEESPERWKPVGLKCCAGACESGGLADHNQTDGANESVIGGCAGRRGSCANAHQGFEDRALHERSPCVQMSKLHGAIERAAKQVDAKKDALANVWGVPCCPTFARFGEAGTNSSLYRRLCHAGACLATQAYVGSVEQSSCKRIHKGLDALIGFLGDTVQTHQQHPQYLGARVKTISTAELSAIITTLATVLRASSKPPELDFLSDNVFSIKVLQRQCRASSNVELIQCR